ncbi:MULTISPECIES: hypothetical protein [Mycobacterium]|uniref:hypothetical protein n=1 Tax=Mycobacterium TaxID=1763 RepID=UPI0007A0DAA4|nr:MULTISPECIES: hypothetical protein [Mycobacterium]MCV7100909.1 hypothetical protein [Mycobacterium palustre]MDV3215724.1 hypothetical protein [Mycobacterium avium]
MPTSSITIGTSPTAICAKSYNSGALIIQNAGAAAVFIGHESVSADGVTPALSLAPGAILTVPRGGATLYGVVESGTATMVALELGNNG